MKPLRSIVNLVAGLLVTSAALAGCGSSESSSDVDVEAPAVLKTIAGTDRFQVTLSADAMARLGIRTAAVRRSGASLSMPYAAVVYDSDGSTWAYIPAKDPLTYLRAAITVAQISGDTATLSAGPAAGTQVVVVGAAELLGAEAQIAGEE